MRTFLNEFDENYRGKLFHRSETMRRVFEELLLEPRPFYTIVETGCVRKIAGDGKQYGPQVPEDHPWYPQGWHGPWSDGQSTILFDRFLQCHNGALFSVDLNPENCRVSAANTSRHTTVHCGDSVAYLNHLKKTRNVSSINLLYLDSYDLDWNNPHASALHHLKELCAIYTALAPGAIVVVDDNKDGQGRSGKGMYVAEFMADIGVSPIFDEYQIGWRL